MPTEYYEPDLNVSVFFTRPRYQQPEEQVSIYDDGSSYCSSVTDSSIWQGAKYVLEQMINGVRAGSRYLPCFSPVAVDGLDDVLEPGDYSLHPR
jgi:hypothetical protein